MTVTIEVKLPEGPQTGENALHAFAAGFSPRIILKLIGLRFMSFVTQQFETRGEGRWAPLARSTIFGRRGRSSEPLQDTGRYRQSFVSDTDEQTFVEVGTNDFRGKIHEYGTKPYVIRAKNGRALAFHGSNGDMVFRKSVNHPGVPARPALPAKAVAERLVQEELDSYLETLAGEVS